LENQLSTTGFQTGLLQAIQKNAIEKSHIVLNSHLDARATHTYYFAILLPSLSYSLPSAITHLKASAMWTRRLQPHS
jgi:hypothetical protein